MTTSTSIFLDALPADALQLGWFVRNKYQPLENVHRTKHEPSDLVKEEFTHILDCRKKDDSQNFQAYLSGLFKLAFGLKTGVSVDLEAASCESQRVVNAVDWFEAACCKEDARMWLERQFKTGGRRVRVWVIVGLLVAKDVKFKVDMHDHFEADADGTIPLSALVALPDRFSSVLVDPGVKIGFENGRETISVLETKSMVYAIQYRRLKFRFFKRSKVPKNLGRPSWKIMTTTAGSAEDDDLVVQAQLGEETGGMGDEDKTSEESGDSDTDSSEDSD
ncbi:hypothetical protein FBEOM_10171 [Fusarium beomiforme]|uniref:Uncharacterized protein n=1 Tax=Fusarium beomiforme TaxID=44412 RepID=A0A9P5ABW7_9HYPO|nr:hypothetical protein FBEOM_10171 [Fusarium beomiforme]